MRKLKLGVACVLLACSAGAWSITISERFESYTLQSLSGQSGWYTAGGTSSAAVVAGNGPTLTGSKCVQMSNAAGNGIMVCKDIIDLVATDKMLLIQYDVRNVTNHSGAHPTTFRFRIQDRALGQAAIGCMHYDGGGDPASQAWANDGSANGWAPGAPAWNDNAWHTVVWKLNYATREFLQVSFDGVQYMQPGWKFADWPGFATKADRLELYLAGPDGNNDVWQFDNIVVTTAPAPGPPIALATAKSRADGAQADIRGIVSAVFAEDITPRFYIQDTLAECGIQVRCSGTMPTVGEDVTVSGVMATDASSRERYVQASGGWTHQGTGLVKPRAMTTRSIGGGAQGLQEAVHQGVGLNNVGLLVRVAGKVTAVASDYTYAYVSDGVPLYDGKTTGAAGIRVDTSSLRPSLGVGDRVVITGVVSMYASGGHCHRSIRVRGFDDVINYDDDGEGPKIFKVLVINFDPIVPSKGMPTHQAFGWNDPHALAQGYANDLKTCSNYWAQYVIVDWVDVNYHAYFTDGFQYSAQDYYDRWSTCGSGCGDWHSGSADYYRIINDFNVAPRIASHEIDEVWMFGSPAGSAFWEAAMAGTTPYFINGGTYYVPAAGRNFAIMGFNYERGVDCMLEDFCHRTECVLSHVYGPPRWWFPSWPPNNNWDRFRMIDQTQPGEAACGFCHFAPNSTADYQWGNPTYVWSTCDDWLYNWPNLQGAKRWVNCSEWGNGDMRLHHVWWLKHLPKRTGVWPGTPGSDKDAGKQNNWWKYTCDFNSYPESR